MEICGGFLGVKIVFFVSKKTILTLMASEEYRQRAISIIQEAIVADGAGNYDDAFRLYLKSFEWFELTIKYEKNPKTAEKVKSKFAEYIQRAEEIKKLLVPDGGIGGSTDSTKFTPIDKPNVKWEDIGGLEEAKGILRQTVVMPIKFPSAFKESGLKPWTGILLYGPPGTGKSMLAKAVATESNYTFLSVSASDLMNKYLGQGERNVKELFQVARARKPTVIFIDEVESMCSQRDESTHEASSRLLSEFLVQIDGVGNDCKDILVLAATNLPWMLDAAMLRRLEQKIYISLPDASARAEMFGNIASSLGGGNISARYAKMTNGYSGADIAIVINRAKMIPLTVVESSTHFKKEAPDRYVPCSPGDPDAIEMTWNDIPHDKLMLLPVTRRDYIRSIRETKPTVDERSLERYEEWTRMFGSGC